ncbi:HNH endonuclease signature motif containing protein [Streptomyces sp. Tu6071]|uniref:HNH endonuclease n=1 Tax=Streptomyces sp. Tu6071 TaxID=355249 RepID=UPI000A304CED
MPRAASICLNRGCVSKTTKDGRCSQHQIRRSWNRASSRNSSRPGDWNSRRARVLARDHFRCQKCNALKDLEVDHIVPVSRGGTWELDNLWVLCKPCHRNKTYYLDRASGLK